MDILEEKFGISKEISLLADKACEELQDKFREFDKTAEINTAKIMAAFRNNKVSDGCFAGTTGYGYDDKGREVLDKIYAEVFGTESALVRIGFVNGTHAITAALFSAVRPGDTLLSATGLPYDTLQSAIGITGDYPGSLAYYNVKYRQVELDKTGKPDIEKMVEALADKTVKAVTVQRSRGYSTRDTLTVEDIGKICDAVHGVNKDIAVIVDNCYGEFTDISEPTQSGADLIAGSLIKNPGGGLAPGGGYIAGRENLVEAAAMRLTTPGIGGECGATLGNNRLLFQGFFNAPHTVAQSLKTAAFCSRLMEMIGYKCSPGPFDRRSDIIQVVELGSADALKLFCKGIQSGAPVDSYVTPEPWDMPGYEDQVIMAAGAFVQGASIELSADGPMREPYCAYMQGGLTFESGKLGIMMAAELLKNNMK